MHEIKDSNWLNSLEQDTAVIVPTRGLLTLIHGQITNIKLGQGLNVWEAPNLLAWQDFLRLLWQNNRDSLSQVLGERVLISSQQSLVLWTQVVEASRRKERELTLLNVQQTAKAVQRSWRLMNEWGISSEKVAQDHVADTEQFLLWLSEYRDLLAKKSLIDEALLASSLTSLTEIHQPFRKIIWHAYDLNTEVQSRLNAKLQTRGVDVQRTKLSVENLSKKHIRYADTLSEIRGSLESARELLEKDSRHKINIVIPDLSLRLAQVRELARDVFYPSLSPMEIQQNSTVYRFSLGQPLAEWAAIDTALSVIALLDNRCTSVELSYLLRSQFLRLSSKYSEACRVFDRWLTAQRMRNLVFDHLPDHYRRCLAEQDLEDEVGFLAKLEELVAQRQDLHQKLKQSKIETDFAALQFGDWVKSFDDWLTAWGWSTNVAGAELNTVQHQLRERWSSLLEEFAGLATVQRRAGLKRAIEQLRLMARDAMFLPKAVASPVLISSLLEAIGRPVETCFLTGMNQSFPPPPKQDAFIPTRLLEGSGNPDANPDASFQQADRVNTSLLSTAENWVISYAELSDQDRDIRNQVSALFRHHAFENVELSAIEPQGVALELYQDTSGPAWPEDTHARGGSKIFENQSNCAFKAFVTHQLRFDQEDEAEFGLDALDRGNVVHQLLDLVWAELHSQTELLSKDDQQLDDFISNIIDQTLNDASLFLNADKQRLVQHEKPRLQRLLKTWLQLEANRPQNFSVIEREESRYGEYAGIRFKYIIDRLDMTDDGATFIVDYKTGTVKRSDWVGERIRKPQLPLYALALDAEKQKSVSGIAFAKVKQGGHEFVELAQDGVFHAKRKQEEEWLNNRAEWGEKFDKLAADFLAGVAEVNPIDEETCRYCELHAVCRIAQLQEIEGPKMPLASASNGVAQ